jgi:chromosome segregation ATPase
MTIISASIKTQHNITDKRLNESDKLLSDKYILAKDIRDLNRSLQESTDTLSKLDDEVKNRLKLKEQLEQYIHASATDKTGSFQHKIYELIEILNTEPEFRELKENIMNEKSDFVNVKQLMIDNTQQLTDKIKILREKIANRNNANSDVLVERDNMKVQMRNIIVEIAGYK